MKYQWTAVGGVGLETHMQSTVEVNGHTIVGDIEELEHDKAMLTVFVDGDVRFKQIAGSNFKNWIRVIEAKMTTHIKAKEKRS